MSASRGINCFRHAWSFSQRFGFTVDVIRFDLRDNYEDGVDDEIYRRKSLRDSYEDDDLSADYDDDLEDYDDDSDEREDDYDDYDAYDEDEFDDDLDDDTYGRSRRGGSAGRQAPGRPSARGGVTRTRGPRRRGRKVASPGIQRIKETLIGAQENLKTTMSSVTHRGAKVMRELKVQKHAPPPQRVPAFEGTPAF